MLLKTIGILLDRALKKEPHYHQLNNLESDVWHKIQQKERSVSICSIFPDTRQLSYASLALFILSSFALSQISFQPIEYKNTFDLELFSPQAPLLLTSTIEIKGNTFS